MSSEYIVILVAAAVLAGFVAGLFGLGGGVVVVPVVYGLLLSLGVAANEAMAMAIATSLVAVFCTGLSSALSHWRYQHVDWSLVRLGAAPLAIGALIGALLVAHLRSAWLGIGFGLFLYLVAVNRWRQHTPRAAKVVRIGLVVPVAASIGVIATLVGVGGGTMTVPALQMAGRTMPVAVGSSAVAGVILSAVASLVLLSVSPPVTMASSIGLVYWPALLVMVPAAIVVAPLGAKCAKILPERWLRRGFIGLLLGNGSWVLLVNLRAIAFG